MNVLPSGLRPALRFLQSNVTAAVSCMAPGSLPGRVTAFPALSQVCRALDECRDSAEAADLANRSKGRLMELLRMRFQEPEAQALTLKALNLLLARRSMRARDLRLSSRPFGLIVDPSNVCQLACPGCVHSEESERLKLFDWPKATLAESRFAALLELYGPTAIGVYFCNYGEPLLNLNTPSLIRMAKTYLAATALSTSLSVRRFDPEAYIRSGLDLMVISIDGVTQSVYERFRRNGNLELVLQNVAKLVDAKRKLRSRTPFLSWNFLAFEHNAHEIPAAREQARTLGLNCFRVTTPFDVTWNDPEIRAAAIPGSVERLDWSSVSNARENWNPFPDRLDAPTMEAAFNRGFPVNTAEKPSVQVGRTCHWLYENMIMDAACRILPCCGAPRAEGKLVFGTLSGPEGDPFNSDKYLQARGFFAGEPGEAAERTECSRCEWNQTAVNIGAPEIRRYFRAADPWFFDRRSVSLLSS